MEEGAEVEVEEVGTGWEWGGEDTGEGAFHGARGEVEGLEVRVEDMEVWVEVMKVGVEDMEVWVEDMEAWVEDMKVGAEGTGEARWVGEDMEVTVGIDSNRIECYSFNYLFFSGEIQICFID